MAKGRLTVVYLAPLANITPAGKQEKGGPHAVDRQPCPGKETHDFGPMKF